MYGTENWTLKIADERKLGAFEEKIQSKLEKLKPELYEQNKDINVVKAVRISRLRWLGHMQRRSEGIMPKRIKDYTPIGKRRVGRPKSRWLDQTVNEASKSGVPRFWLAAMNRELQGKLLLDSKAQALEPKMYVQ